MDILKITKINEEMTNNPYEYIKKCEEKFVYKVKKAGDSNLKRISSALIGFPLVALIINSTNTI